MYKKILVPVEHTNADQTILEHIRKLATFCQAELIFIHVADGFAARLQNDLNLVDSEEIQKDRRYLQELEKTFRRENFTVSSELGLGDPVREILKSADRHQCDLIAMTTHGHGFLKDLIFGTVAESVRHRTSIPVLLLRMPQ